MPSLSITLLPEHVVDVESGERDAVLGALVDAVEKAAKVPRDQLLRAVNDREALCSTGLGSGCAMPHVRLPGVKTFQTALARTRAGIEFAAPDGKPVQLLLLVVGPLHDRDGYLKLMARAARFLKNESPRLLASDDLAAAVAEVTSEY